MTPNKEYFKRLEGPWSWKARFELMNWKELWFSDLSFSHKVRVFGMLVHQSLFGPFAMRTSVDFSDQTQVRHSAQLTKFGITFYRSRKRFTLDPNGHDLHLEGEEFFWPLAYIPRPFKDLRGRVESSAMLARYQWPMFERVFKCETLLGPNQGSIHIDTGWMKATFQLTPESLQFLNNRKLL